MPCGERRAGLRGVPQCWEETGEKVVTGNPGCETERKDPDLEKARKASKKGWMEQIRPKVTGDIKLDRVKNKQKLFFNI